MNDNVNLEMGSTPTLLERHWPKLALLLTLALFAGLLFAPAFAQGFALPFIVLTLGMGILLLALRHWRALRQAQDRPTGQGNYPGLNWHGMSLSKPPACCWPLAPCGPSPWPVSSAAAWQSLSV